jgi:hypothetical protein
MHHPFHCRATAAVQAEAEENIQESRLIDRTGSNGHTFAKKQISSIEGFQGIQKQKKISHPHFLPSRDFYPDATLVEFCCD